MVEFNENNENVINVKKAETERVFTIKDLDEISYRQLNDWDKRGHLRTSNREYNSSWRKFSALNLVALKVIKDLKKNMYSDEAINNIIDQFEVLAKVLGWSLLSDKKEQLYYIVTCQYGAIAILKGKDSLLKFHEEVSENSGLSPLLNESMLIIPVGLYYKKMMILYYKKQLEISKKSETNPFNDLPHNIKKMVVLDILKDEQYYEILIRKKNKDYIIEPKSKENKLTISEIEQLINKADFQEITINSHKGNKLIYYKPKIKV